MRTVALVFLLLAGLGKAKEQLPPQPLATFHGTVAGMEKRVLLVKDGEGNTLQFEYSRKTRCYDGSKEIKVSELREGDPVEVEARRTLDGRVEAVTVRRARAPN